eukprot:TRINITY_DN53448_c0_g1_i1.p1 TRINITY_DN53448_c0_g1~~TRINITY_DN53448_c0_g1_i1.p1  ORF type:complete len:448 (+),score=69.92 TRINITY_DN53448_c0_g1_i1:44-1345(+)
MLSMQTGGGRSGGRPPPGPGGGGRSQENRISPAMPDRHALAQVPEVQALAQHLQLARAGASGISKSEMVLCAGTNGDVDAVTANIAMAVQQFGPSPGAKKMMKAEQAAAEEAVRTGLYGVWRNSSSGHDFCGRIGPLSRCFCGHDYSQHSWKGSRKEVAPACMNCPCKQFRYMPRRPEEVGEAWLVRRRGFDITKWRAKCKCDFGHDAHDPNSLGCPGSMGKYQSAWLCVSCDGKWEDHESVWESEEERRMMNRPTGQDFMPLASTPGIQQAVLEAPESSTRSFSLPHRPRPERSVRLMQERCPNYGGPAAGSLEDAFPPRGGSSSSRNSPSMGRLEDAFPPRNAGSGHTLGSLEDAFPPRSSGGSSGLRRLEDAPLPRRDGGAYAEWGSDAFPSESSSSRRGPVPKAKPSLRPPRSRASTPGSRPGSGQHPP